MKGLLIYQAEDLRKNRWFAKQLCDEVKSYGLELMTVTAEGLSAGFPADFIVNRSRVAAISQAYERKGVRCFNRAPVTDITNDKWKTHCFLQQHGLPVAQTVLCTQQTPPPGVYPAVCKPLDGHGGAGVQLVRNDTEYLAAKATLPENFLVQQPMVYGWDTRVYVLDGKPYAAMLRTSQSDFRSNFTLGGEAKQVTPDAQQCALVAEVTKRLKPDFVGIDLLRHPDGGYVIGEIEDAVGCRMLYQYTKRNPVQDFAALIAGEMLMRL